MVKLLALSLLLLAANPAPAQQGGAELPTLEFRVGLEPGDLGYEEGEELPFRDQDRTAVVGPPRFFHIQKAELGQDHLGYPAIQCRISGDEEDAFRAWTGEIVDRQMAIVVDGEIVSMPYLTSELGGLFIIMGQFTEEEALEIASRLGGAHPEPIPFFVRVVRGEDGAPLEGARVLLDGDGFAGRTDEAGLLEVPVRYVHTEYATVRARGRSTVYVFVSKGHATPERAISVELTRTCALEGRVLESDGSPLADAFVRLSTPRRFASHPPWAAFLWAWFPTEWKYHVNDRGEYRIRALPAGSPLRFEIVSGIAPALDLDPSIFPDPDAWREEAVLSHSDECLLLSPGEDRSLDWALPPRCDLGGFLVDQDGLPVSDQELWVMQPQGRVARPDVFGWHRAPVARTRTSSTGAFRFSNIVQGPAILGPAPPAYDDSPEPEVDISHVAMPVMVEPRELGDGLVLRAGRGLTIRGKVVGPDDRPMAGVQVSAQPDGGSGYVEAEADERGLFTVGPLAPGRYRVYAHGGPDDWPFGATYEAGESEALVRVAAASSIEGRIEGPSGGVPTHAAVHVARRGSTWPGGRSSEADWGTFSTQDLGAGTYDVTAVTAGGQVGILEGVEVPEGADVDGLVVELMEGAQLRVHLIGPCRKHMLSVRRGEVRVGADQVFGGVPSVLLLPPGKLRVSLYDWDFPLLGDLEPLAELEVELEAGQEKEITFRIR